MHPRRTKPREGISTAGDQVGAAGAHCPTLPAKPQTKKREDGVRGVSRRAQHRHRLSRRCRSARGLWGGFEELSSEKTGGGAAPQEEQQSHKPRNARTESEEFRGALSTATD